MISRIEAAFIAWVFLRVSLFLWGPVGLALTWQLMLILEAVSA